MMSMKKNHTNVGIGGMISNLVSGWCRVKMIRSHMHVHTHLVGMLIV